MQKRITHIIYLVCIALSLMLPTSVSATASSFHPNTGPHFYSQHDPVWLNTKIGKWRFGPTGCVPTSVAMAVNGYGVTVTPLQVGRLLNKQSDFNHSIAGASGAAVEYAISYYDLVPTPIDTLEDLNSSLQNGDTVIALVNPGTFTNVQSTHAITLYGYTEGSKTQVYDPLAGKKNGWYETSEIFDQKSTDAFDNTNGHVIYSVSLYHVGSFIDISKDNVFQPDILWLAETNITSGTSPTTYSPKGKVTREQMATFLYRLAGEPDRGDISSQLLAFEDIADDNVHKPDIAWLLKSAITSGTTPTTYSPKQPVTREQMATFLYRLAGSPAYTPTTAELNKFKDIASSQHKNAIAWLINNEITNGTSPTTFSPKNITTREQMSTFLHRTYDKFLAN